MDRVTTIYGIALLAAFSIYMIGCGCDEKALSHKETSAREVEKCICLDKEPWDYSVLLETTDKTFAVQYTVKYVHQWNSNFFTGVRWTIKPLTHKHNPDGLKAIEYEKIYSKVRKKCPVSIHKHSIMYEEDI